jgi:hypothetical protein
MRMAIVLVVVLAASLLASNALAQDFYVRGNYYVASDELGAAGEWGADSGNLLVDDGTSGDLVAGDGIFSRLVTSTQLAGDYEMKVGMLDWSMSYPDENIPVFLTEDNQSFLVTHDTNTYADGFLPATNIVTTDVWYTPTMGWYVVGEPAELGAWDETQSVQATELASGLFRLEATFAADGTINYKWIADQTYGPIEAAGTGFQKGSFANAMLDVVAQAGYAFVLNPVNGRIKAGPVGAVSVLDLSWGRVKSQFQED